MQKFKVRLKNVPTNTPQVCSSTTFGLNRDQSLSDQGIVQALNNPDVDQHQHKGGRNLRVPVIAYVLNQRGQPLMPCSPRKAKLLLKKGEAKVVKTNPFFVIQLKKATGESVKKCSIGINSGSKHIGFSVIDDKKEIVSGTLELDCKTSERLTERRMYRKGRRNRLWYRKPRFNNRNKIDGWLPPSVQRKFDTHITLINKLKNILPITSIHIEAGKFNIQKIMNPEIKGIGYQQGPLYEYQNIRSYLMAREHGKCQLCGKDFGKGNEAHIHHKKPRSDGGTDSEKNLALLHKKCHKKLHDKKLFHLLKSNKVYKDATFMNIIRLRFKEFFSDCIIKYGYETFIKRNEINLEKTHSNDAFVIANGIAQIKNTPITLKQKHRNNRVLQVNRKGYKPSIRMKRYSIQPYDIVTVNNKEYFVKGCHSYGKCVRCSDGIKTFNFNVKKIKRCFHTKSIFSDK